MTPSSRPREKMLKMGVGALTDAELLAVLLRTGVRGRNAVELSMNLLNGVNGNLETLSRMSVGNLCKNQGIGHGKAIVIACAVEFGRRLASSMLVNGKMVMDNPQDAARLLAGLYSTESREECWCLMLKRNRRLISSVKISEGGETMTEISIKAITRGALDVQAAAVILSHNHPGGDPRPSAADIKETMKLKRALETFEITLMDHIIISGNECYSFSTENVFPL